MQVCEVCLLCHTLMHRVVGGLMPRAFIILPQLVSAILILIVYLNVVQ